MHYTIEIRQNNKLISSQNISADAGSFQRGQLAERLVASLPPYDPAAGALEVHEVLWNNDHGREVNRYEVQD